MGLDVGHSSLHRYVQKQETEMPVVLDIINNTSIDGGKIRMRGEVGEKSYYRDYKIARVNSQWYGAAYQQNSEIIDWLNSQKQAVPLVCVGDGHDGVWNMFQEIGVERMEILDWYHLKEHLCGVGGSFKRLRDAEKLLWEGNVPETVSLFIGLKSKKAVNFIAYIQKHQSRIINYNYWKNMVLNPIPVGSGDVESAVKQMGARVKLPGARWKEENVNQILSLRCAYLNGLFDIA
jgi:hypothetical protein